VLGGFWFDPETLLQAALRTTLHSLENLDTLYVDCSQTEIHLVGFKNGKAIYTTSIKVKTPL
jgi:hypothetical protein